MRNEVGLYIYEVLSPWNKNKGKIPRFFVFVGNCVLRLNLELDLKIYLGSCVLRYSLAETPRLPPSLHIWAHIRGRYWSAKTDDISL
jgi:hypothetical protein